MLSPALQRGRLREASTTPKPRIFTMHDCHGFSRRGAASLRCPKGSFWGRLTFVGIFEMAFNYSIDKTAA